MTIIEAHDSEESHVCPLKICAKWPSTYLSRIILIYILITCQNYIYRLLLTWKVLYDYKLISYSPILSSYTTRSTSHRTLCYAPWLSVFPYSYPFSNSGNSRAATATYWGRRSNQMTRSSTFVPLIAQGTDPLPPPIVWSHLKLYLTGSAKFLSPLLTSLLPSFLVVTYF
jgi:hypothetical protein